eukprot:6484145-Amphidinium_carterae.1
MNNSIKLPPNAIHSNALQGCEMLDPADPFRIRSCNPSESGGNTSRYHAKKSHMFHEERNATGLNFPSLIDKFKHS